MRYQFGSGRPQLPFTNANLVATAGGSLTSQRLLYFALQGENPAGLNQLSITGLVLIPAGSQLRITLPPEVRRTGEAWESYVISASTSNDPESFVQLAKVDANDENGAAIALPTSIIFSSDDHFKLSNLVNTPELLPPNPLNGALCAVSSLGGAVFEYDANSALDPNGSTILEADEGAWIYRPGSFSTYVEDLTEGGGCDTSLGQLTENLIRAPRYACTGGNGAGRTYWINNVGPDEINAGKRVGLTVLLNDVPQSDEFDGALRMRFRGYVNTTTGERRTTYADGDEFPDLDEEKLFENKRTDIFFPDDLQEGEAYALTVYPNFEPAELNNQVPDGAVLKAAPFVFLQAGAYSEIGEALGNWIYPTGDRGWVVPSLGGVKCLKRFGMVSSRSFLGTGPTEIFGFSEDTSSQLVVLNGNGAAYLRQGALEQNEAIRAVVSFESGVGAASAWSAPFNITAGQGLRVTCSYPGNATSAPIRGDYPDVIAGLAGRAQLNAPFVTLYVEVDGMIKRFSSRAVVAGSSQQFELSDWANAEAIATVPAASSDDFGLFTAVGATGTGNGTGSFPESMNVRVAFAFEYDGSQASRISHDPLRCIHAASLTLAQMELSAQSWAPPALNLINLRAIQPSGRYPYQSRYVPSEGDPYRWHPLSSEADDNKLVIRPKDVPADMPGRWLKDTASQIYSGEVDPPPPGLGEPGDYYLNRSTGTARGNLYYKTAPTTWDLALNIKGEKGDRGLIYRGEWSQDTRYFPDDFVTRNNSSYLALQQVSGQDPDFIDDDSENWKPLARGLFFRGEWESGIIYGINALVTYQSKIWLAVQSSQSEYPTDYLGSWQFLAAGINVRGIFDEFEQYSINDVVEYRPGNMLEDGTYIYINPAPSSGYFP
ncbi:hypothetical protein H6G00_02025, partial [Leptolyngbya sp. FACHB-541]|uniref:hypothetical protein n=1 Tax=Leptolyngbya sp. FACHB-541 TaxID=2692810 RepID=UPI00168986A9